MRLPNGYGSVYKLSGNRRKPWIARKTTGWTYNEDTGKSYPVYYFIGSYKTKSDALQALADYNKDPLDLHIERMTLEELYDRWSDEHFPEVSHSNVVGCKAAWKLCDRIKDMRLFDLKLDHFQTICDESGKNAPTLKKLKITLGLMYDYAVKHEIVSKEKRDMIRYIDIKKAGNPNAYNRKPFTSEQVEQLWKCTSNEYMTVILILIYTGLRIGELLDLTKEDIHLEERWFFVKESKTESGIREVPIAEKIVPFMEYWIQRPCDHLICSPSDEPFTGKNGYRKYYDTYWKPLMKEVNFEHRPHDTRHTCISMLTQAGIDERIIKKIVGHKGQGVTETVYTHLELPIKLEAINKI